jgi:hypothetical protein
MKAETEHWGYPHVLEEERDRVLLVNGSQTSMEIPLDREYVLMPMQAYRNRTPGPYWRCRIYTRRADGSLEESHPLLDVVVSEFDALDPNVDDAVPARADAIVRTAEGSGKQRGAAKRDAEHLFLAEADNAALPEEPPDLRHLVAPPNDWRNDPTFLDAMLDPPPLRPDPGRFDPEEGYVLRDPAGAFAFDMAVRILTQAVDVLPRHWQLVDVRVERRRLHRRAVVEVLGRDGRNAMRQYERWQIAETMMPGNPWLEQHGFKVIARISAHLRAERSGG